MPRTPCSSQTGPACDGRHPDPEPPELVPTLQLLTGFRLPRRRPASHVGLAPVPRDSGRRTGDSHRPERCNRRLRWLFSTSAQSAMMRPGPSRNYYLKKRAEGLIHTQALPALAHRPPPGRRAILRGKRLFTSAPPVTRTA